MASHPKIRVGLIGLNAPYASSPTGTSWAANAHLKYLKASSKYELVALQNSSAERAAAAIKAYDLDRNIVKAYGTPEDLAKDPSVDLVVSCIRVDRHAGSLIPSIKAGKDVFVEWPIEANYFIAKELTDLVRAHKVRNVVGLQASFSPIVQKVKATIENGDIGKVESSTVIAKGVGGPTIPSMVEYFIDRKVGGNLLTITWGHTMEAITTVLGETSSHHSLLVNQYPLVDVVDSTTHIVLEKARPNDVPNQIVFNAILKSGAILSYKHQNSATISPGSPAFTPAPIGGSRVKFPNLEWRIFGSKGEIRISSFGPRSLNVGSEDIKVEICKAEVGVVEDLDIENDDWAHLPIPARNIARLYEAFAQGVTEEGEKREWYPDFDYALKRHQLIEEMYRENGF